MELAVNMVYRRNRKGSAALMFAPPMSNASQFTRDFLECDD